MTTDVSTDAEAAAQTPMLDDAPVLAYRVKSRPREVAETILPPVLMGSALIGFWYLVSYVVLDESRRFLLRAPHEVWSVGFADWDNFSEILQALWSSTRVAVIGLAIAISIGFVLATVMSQAKVIERAIFPFMVTLQAIPILAIVPLISFWWGTGQRSRIVVCIIISLFPIIVNTLFGLQSAERGAHDLFTLHRAGRLTRLRKLMFPAAMPSSPGCASRRACRSSAPSSATSSSARATSASASASASTPTTSRASSSWLRSSCPQRWASPSSCSSAGSRTSPSDGGTNQAPSGPDHRLSSTNRVTRS